MTLCKLTMPTPQDWRDWLHAPDAPSRNPFIFDPKLSTLRFRKPIAHRALKLSWLQALDRCNAEGRDYTEIHFYRHPETDELVLTYWEIEP